MQLFWHRRDLRVSDNRGLAAAADAADEHGPVVPVFAFDPLVLEHGSPARVAFMLDALDSLRERYRDLGSDLVVLDGEPTGSLMDAVADFRTDKVTWNEGYSGLSRERDETVRMTLEDAEVAHESLQDDVLHHPDSIRTNQGDPYSVYTYYWKKWQDAEKVDAVDVPDADALVDRETLDAEADLTTVGDLPTLSDLGFEEPDAEIPPAGTEEARGKLGAFCAGPIYEYDDARDYPARDASSRLSAHLKFGTIGVREVWEATVDARAEAAGERDENAEAFQSQLAWREFYTQVLYHNPEVVTENYKEYEEGIDWREDQEALDAWKAGKTGYPIVDAGMRQLRAEAWMHNRVRMIVASFLTKDLLLDWRHGYEWFHEHLVDHDTAADNGGWQWAASTGTDAQPYFRIFNPMTQGERYDPDAAYVTAYAPELRGVDPALIHDWHTLSPTQREQVAPDYPAPIVDHSERREQAIAMFERARDDD
jgi:deoxyribodipyrimidine photo-lyase